MENYDIIVLSRRNDNCQHIKPTKVTIREFGSIVCVEYPIKLGILRTMYGHSPVIMQVLSPDNRSSGFFLE